ncbi:MAG: DUF3667 domain-containing protein [Bacteroidia bacterium]
MNCRNCGHTVNDQFCSKCGQKSNVSRINFTNFIDEVSQSLLQIDKGFFYTLKELSVRPGNTLKEYLDGKRISHFKPIAYLLTLSTVYFFITKVTDQNTLIGDLVQGWMNGASELHSNVEIPNIASWFLANYAYTALLLLPIFSLASYIAFLTFQKTYLEHVVLNAYITGHQALLYSFFAVIGTVTGSPIFEMLPAFVAVSYTFWVFWQFFSPGNRAMNILRSLMTYSLYLILSTMLLGFLMINKL